MRILLTGASGMLGRAITRAMLSNHVEVIAYLHDSERAESYEADFPMVKVVKGDIADIAIHKEEIGDIDACLHLAWSGTSNLDRLEEALQQANVEISKSVYALARRLGAKYFFFAGSQAEYGRLGLKGPEKEDVVAPETAYGKAKAEFGEWLKKQAAIDGIRYVHGRIYSVYGPEDRPNSLLSLLAKAQKEKTVLKLGPCTQRWNFLFSEDFGRLIYLSLIDNAFEGELNLASPETKPLREFVAQGFKGGYYRYSEINPNPEGLIDLYPDLTKLLSLAKGFAFTPFEEGVKSLGQ